MNRHDDLRRSRPFDDRAFLLLVAIVTVAFGWVVAPFFNAVFWSTVLAVLFMPLYRWFDDHDRSPRLAVGAYYARRHPRDRDRSNRFRQCGASAGSGEPRCARQVGRARLCGSVSGAPEAVAPVGCRICDALGGNGFVEHPQPRVRKLSRDVAGGRRACDERRPEHVWLLIAARTDALRALFSATGWHGPRAAHSRGRTAARGSAARSHEQIRHRDSRHRQR